MAEVEEEVKKKRRTRRASNGVPGARTISVELMVFLAVCAGIAFILIFNSLDRDEADAGQPVVETYTQKVKRLSDAGNCDAAIAAIEAAAANGDYDLACRSTNVLSDACFAEFRQKNYKLERGIAYYCSTGHWRE